MEKCHNCSDRLTDTGRGRPQKFCSDRCRKVHGRLNGQKVASTAGKGLGGPIAHEDQLGLHHPSCGVSSPSEGADHIQRRFPLARSCPSLRKPQTRF